MPVKAMRRNRNGKAVGIHPAAARRRRLNAGRASYPGPLRFPVPGREFFYPAARGMLAGLGAGFASSTLWITHGSNVACANGGGPLATLSCIVAAIAIALSAVYLFDRRRQNAMFAWLCGLMSGAAGGLMAVALAVGTGRDALCGYQVGIVIVSAGFLLLLSAAIETVLAVRRKQAQ